MNCPLCKNPVSMELKDPHEITTETFIEGKGVILSHYEYTMTIEMRKCYWCEVCGDTTKNIALKMLEKGMLPDK